MVVYIWQYGCILGPSTCTATGGESRSKIQHIIIIIMLIK